MFGKIGVRGHDYGQSTIEDLSKKIVADGYASTQLALKKALVDAQDLEAVLNEEYAQKVSKALKEAGLEVSVLGAYLNYAGLDDKQRDKNLEILKKHLQLAKTMGVRMVGTETGSLDDSYKAHPDNHQEEAFLRFKDAVLKALEVAHDYDSIFAVEAVAHHIIHTPQRMNRLVREINDDRLKVIFDINNLMTIDNYQEQDSVLKEAFDLLDDKIVVVHVKDFDFVDGEKVIVPLGQGKLNVELLFDLVGKSSQQVDMLGENVAKDELVNTYIKMEKYLQEAKAKA